MLDCIVAGQRNRHIAAELDISERTVTLHRGTIMPKMEVGSVAQLARLIERLDPQFGRRRTGPPAGPVWC